MKRFHVEPGLLLTSILLATLCALQLLCLARAPDAYSPAAVIIALAPGQSIALGEHELAAPQAAQVQLGLRRGADGRWWARNLDGARGVRLQQNGFEHRLDSSTVSTGQRWRIGAASFVATASSEREISFNGAGAEWRFDGATLYRDGKALAACPDAGAGARLIALWNRAMPHPLTMARAMTMGGNLHCGNRLGIADLGGASAILARSAAGQLRLSAPNAARAGTPLLIDGADLALREQALAGVSALGIGRTRFQLRLHSGHIELLPQRHVALASAPQSVLPPQVSWRWQQRAAWTLVASEAWWFALLLCALAGGAALLNWQRGAWPFVRDSGNAIRAGAAATALLFIAGVSMLMLLRAGAAPGLGWSLLLGWAALWSWLLLPARLTLVTAAAVLLLAIGLLSQLELGLGSMESSALRYYQKTVALLAIGLGAGGYLRLRLRAGAVMPRTRMEWTLAMLAAAALAGLVLQVVLGDETGVFDLQPVEFAKLALTALTAHCIAVGLGWHAAMPERVNPLLRWLRLAAPALLFAALLGLALLQVDDYSPLILLLVWCLAMALAWSLATRQRVVGAGLLGVALLGVAAIALVRNAGADQVAHWGFYGDRFLVWLDPLQHPHTGQQMLAAANAIAQGAWWGSDSLLGISSLGQAGGSALAIPAVQDDFAPSFFLNRHGLLAALALWGLQALFLTGLLQTAARAFAASEQARDFRQAWLGRFRCFALCGGAAFVLGHFLLSWGTNLAIFPIMGQPMSFLSAGGSHLLFFICPLLAFSAISAQSLEEFESCRSTSNTKF